MYLTVYLPYETTEDEAERLIAGTNAEYAMTGNTRLEAGDVRKEEVEIWGDSVDIELVQARLGAATREEEK